MINKCSVIDVLMKPNIIGIPLFIVLCLITLGIYIGHNTYKNSKEYLEKSVNHNTFVFSYTIMIILLYVIINKLLENPTMIGYYLFLSKKPNKIIC